MSKRKYEPTCITKQRMQYERIDGTWNIAVGRLLVNTGKLRGRPIDAYMLIDETTDMHCIEYWEARLNHLKIPYVLLQAYKQNSGALLAKYKKKHVYGYVIMCKDPDFLTRGKKYVTS